MGIAERREQARLEKLRIEQQRIEQLRIEQQRQEQLRLEKLRIEQQRQEQLRLEEQRRQQQLLLKQHLPQLPLRNWTRGEGGGSWHLPGGVQHWQEVDHPAWRIPCLTILPMSSFLAQPEPKLALPSVTHVNNVFSVAADSSVSWTGQIF